MSDAATNKPPRQITDSVHAKCAACGAVIYDERHTATLQADGSYAHQREVVGYFRQVTDADGNPAGPVVPFCACKEPAHAQG